MDQQVPKEAICLPEQPEEPMIHCPVPTALCQVNLIAVVPCLGSRPLSQIGWPWLPVARSWLAKGLRLGKLRLGAGLLGKFCRICCGLSNYSCNNNIESFDTICPHSRHEDGHNKLWDISI